MTNILSEILLVKDCSVKITYTVKEDNPYPMPGMEKMFDDKSVDTPSKCGGNRLTGIPCLSQKPTMPSMAAKFEHFKKYFLSKKADAEAAATKRAMSCMGCAKDMGANCMCAYAPFVYKDKMRREYHGPGPSQKHCETLAPGPGKDPLIGQGLLH